MLIHQVVRLVGLAIVDTFMNFIKFDGRKHCYGYGQQSMGTIIASSGAKGATFHASKC